MRPCSSVRRWPNDALPQEAFESQRMICEECAARTTVGSRLDLASGRHQSTQEIKSLMQSAGGHARANMMGVGLLSEMRKALS